jgi:DMSO reductase family type II enzyme heme b subunit
MERHRSGAGTRTGAGRSSRRSFLGESVIGAASRFAASTSDDGASPTGGRRGLHAFFDLNGCGGFIPKLPRGEFPDTKPEGEFPAPPGNDTKQKERKGKKKAAGPGKRARSRKTPSPSPSPSPHPKSFLLGMVLAAAFAATPVHAQDATTQADHPGKPTYDKWCAGCHGVDGAGQGDGAAMMLPRPRDFTKALYQIRTTGSGQLPTDADIRHVIDVGMPGTAMPGWEEALTEQERDNLVSYLKTFSRFFGQGDPPEPLDFGSAPGASDERIAEGRDFFQRIECWKCHGQEGRGDGQSAPTQTDDDGFPIRPADLTEPWLFNGGGTVEDIYRRLRTGMDGTPMPTFGDLIAADFMTDDQLWSVAHYVHSLAPDEDARRVREVVRAVRVDGALPTGPADSAWNDVERFYIPLVAQIIIKPRWFAPTVDGVWVQAVHDGSELALRLSWSDPSESPDPVWNEWRGLVASAAGGVDADAPPAAAGPAAATADTAPPAPADATAATPAGAPDAIAVQFPPTIPTGMDRPYFLMGSTRDPVYLWHWTSGGAGATEQSARGLGRMDPLPDANALTGEAAWEHGQWRVVLRRALVVGDTAAAAADTTAGAAETAAPDDGRLRFANRQPIPMALFAWDGDNGEAGTRGSVSSWYFIYLDEPTPPTVYATPIVAILLTAGLGFFMVGRAQRRNGVRSAGREALQDA